MRLYVGNLPFSTTTEGLQEHFGAFGQVDEVAIISDRQTGRSRGFGFVTMANEEDGRRAIDELNGKELDGRSLVVNEARPRTEGGGGHSRY
ncbi:MAG: RNA recognition motif domain-containing protein [Planctomycetota bacterium]|jgi:RNA recognition motif-containing protein